MREIPLTQGKIALIDDEDYELISQYKWCAHQTFSGHWYAKAKGGKISMHRLLMGAKKGEQIDHVDGKGLDNRRANLRFATQMQNNGNMKKQTGTSSQYKGVAWDKSRSKWIVHIHRGNKQFFLGRFENEEDAARVYDAAAKEYFGEFAYTNF